ncbi:MAG: ATP-dependent helicase [Bacteroidetes bacterium]|nr:ATP-dependent helicase [Bacteroidota bacterium]
MKAIKERDWIPVGGLELEDNALKVVEAPVGNTLVVAGPGAGKTELLAQRACFLLQTNLCRYPHRILAISFKRDAAYNLKERVALRAGAELSGRFDSLTYDSFAKQILDRFKAALPEEYELPDMYEVINEEYIIGLYRHKDERFVNTNSRNGILNAFTETKLPLQKTSEPDLLMHAVWMNAIKNGRLTFRMIMRLSEMVLSVNPKIKQYLQETYDYVFLDEFQDTTSIQYSFLNTCFIGSEKVLTAVGDDKQRIMLWAGAKKAIFEDFQTNYNAERIPLKMNFRSAPLLVKVQNSLIKSLLNKTDYATASPKWKGDEGECMIWEFENQKHEASKLVKEISSWLKNEKLDPREICILVKGSLTKYVAEIIDALRASGIGARDESLYQEFLTDELILYLVHGLYMIFNSAKVESKSIVFSFLSRVNNELSDHQLLKLENRLSVFVKKLKNEFHGKPIGNSEIDRLVQSLLDYANQDRIRAIIPQYRQKAYLLKMVSDFEKSLSSYAESGKSFTDALDQFCGRDTIPVMTVHKSKGLEYHTIIFVGLEDGAFWSFNSQPDEDKSTFFVALSRAKSRVIFTFSKNREGLKWVKQARQSIKVIFDELAKAGVKIQIF